MKFIKQPNKLSSRSSRSVIHLNLLRSAIIMMLLLLGLTGAPITAQAQPTEDVLLHFTIDRSAVPRLTYNALTLKIYLGSAEMVSATADGHPAQVTFNPNTGYALVTTTGTNLVVSARHATITPQFGSFAKTIFRDDKKWAWSHGFDDNVEFKVHGIPAFDAYGWRATVYLIGNKIDTAMNQSWILDSNDIITLANKGWAIGNHTWSHNTVDALGGPAAAASDIAHLDTYLRQLMNQAGRPDYRLMSFAAPEFDTNYLPVILSLRDSHTTDLLFDDSGNNFFLRMDPGATEANYSRFGLFDYNGELGRDFRVNGFGTGNSDDQGLRADIATMLSRLDGTHHYWLNTFSHGVDNQYPSQGIFAFLPWLYNNYGPGGDNSVWVAPAEEIYSYKMVYDNVKIIASSPAAVVYKNWTWLPLLGR